MPRRVDGKLVEVERAVRARGRDDFDDGAGAGGGGGGAPASKLDAEAEEWAAFQEDLSDYDEGDGFVRSRYKLTEAGSAEAEAEDVRDALMSSMSNAEIDRKHNIFIDPKDHELDSLVQGRLAAYNLSYDEDEVDVPLLVALLSHICEGKCGDGAILVFLPGWASISQTTEFLEADVVMGDPTRVRVMQLHSQIQIKEQRMVFNSMPKGVRKVVLSTNIAETSITIDDIVFVIDSGKVKSKDYDPHTKISTFQSHWVSKASAAQRHGRAGRCQPGIAFQLFSSKVRCSFLLFVHFFCLLTYCFVCTILFFAKRFEAMKDFTPPAILTTQLEEMCLQIKMLEPALRCVCVARRLSLLLPWRSPTPLPFLSARSCAGSPSLAERARPGAPRLRRTKPARRRTARGRWQRRRRRARRRRRPKPAARRRAPCAPSNRFLSTSLPCSSRHSASACSSLR